MSTTNQIAGPSQSNHNFAAIFQAAESEYETVTGNPLRTHPFATQLDACHSPEAVLNILRKQAQALSRSRKRDERLMAWLDPTVHILFSFSGTLGGLPFSPVKMVFTGICVLLAAARDVSADYNKFVHLFERIHFFVQRLNGYTEIALTKDFTELLGKIMAQVLSTLALSTKAMSERRIKKYLKKLVGRSDVEDALLRLESLTKEECLMAVVKSLERTDVIQRNQLQANLQTWLSPPDSSLNHHNICKIQHEGTGSWFIHCSKFRDWKKNGSLLWIRGNPGAGKTVLCSAIIEDIKNIREETSALVAYHYFDYKDTSKCNVRGLLASLLSQLSGNSDRCRNVLCQLYDKCRNGSERPSEASLAESLNSMIKTVGRIPVFIIMDALDECPNTTGTPSARDEVLYFVRDLLGSNHSNLFLSITSRPEQDIQTVLNPLTSASLSVALHEESGQREDINRYVRSFVYTDNAMRRWREEDKELVIDTLSERASGMFRWVFCQLDTLRRCFPPSIRKTLDELPTTLDETYQRTLEGIPKEKRQYAHRLFQCLVAAIRPLRTEELAEIFAFKFDEEAGGYLMEGWRPENPEEDILSACSTLISIIDADGDSRIVQFSHFSVKEYLTSDRLQKSEVGNIHQLYISLDAAHTILAQVSLTVLLQLGEKVEKKHLVIFSLAFYAAQHWFVHAKYEGVAPRIQGMMETLFSPSNPYLAAWLWIYDIDQGGQKSIDTLADRPSCTNATAWYYAVSCGLCGPAKYLILTHGEDINANTGDYGSPLHAASAKGHLDAMSLLLDHGADVNITNEIGKTPLHAAYVANHFEGMRLLLEHGATPDMQNSSELRLAHYASHAGNAQVIRLLLQHNADINATDYSNLTPLHWASRGGRTDVTEIFLEHGADINALSYFGTPLFHASEDGYLNVAMLLLARGADVHIRAPGWGTPYQVATRRGHTQIAQLLLEHGAEKE